MAIESHTMWTDEASQHDRNAPDSRHTPQNGVRCG
jgi:hypothetical protein